MELIGSVTVNNVGYFSLSLQDLHVSTTPEALIGYHFRIWGKIIKLNVHVEICFIVELHLGSEVDKVQL